MHSKWLFSILGQILFVFPHTNNRSMNDGDSSPLSHPISGWDLKTNTQIKSTSFLIYYKPSNGLHFRLLILEKICCLPLLSSGRFPLLFPIFARIPETESERCIACLLYTVRIRRWGGTFCRRDVFIRRKKVGLWRYSYLPRGKHIGLAGEFREMLSNARATYARLGGPRRFSDFSYVDFPSFPTTIFRRRIARISEYL